MNRISNIIIQYFNSDEKLLKLRSNVKLAEESRLRGEPTVSLSEARERLEQKYSNQ
jgi:hypothetical protein